MPPPFPTCEHVLPGASPPTRERRRCACRAACGAASRCSRSAPHRPKTPGSYGRAGCTTEQRGRLPALAGSLPQDCARARCPGTHDAIHLSRSRITPLVQAPGCCRTAGAFAIEPLQQELCLGSPKSGGEERSQGWAPESFAKQTRRALAKPASFWVPLTEGRRWYAMGGKALASPVWKSDRRVQGV